MCFAFSCNLCIFFYYHISITCFFLASPSIVFLTLCSSHCLSSYLVCFRSSFFLLFVWIFDSIFLNLACFCFLFVYCGLLFWFDPFLLYLLISLVFFVFKKNDQTAPALPSMSLPPLLRATARVEQTVINVI